MKRDADMIWCLQLTALVEEVDGPGSTSASSDRPPSSRSRSLPRLCSSKGRDMHCSNYLLYKMSYEQ
jgi:hypothetical protein